MRNRFVQSALVAAAAVGCNAAPAIVSAHDTWVQTQSSLVRVGDVVHVDLMLGNHGNDHRDFKIASKVSPESCTLEVIAPGGTAYDLKPDLVDLGYAPKEGFWSARFVPGEEGVHAVVQMSDSIHGTKRGLKSAKTYFLAAESLDKPTIGGDEGFAKPLGHPLEIVLLSHPATLGPGMPFGVQVLYEGKPLEGAKVSFVPRGTVLAEGLDSEYERTTGADGKANFTPKEGNFVLVSVHKVEPEQKGEGYDTTGYTATLLMNVPQICPCCE
jgi:uncharacterized GH25 family protein